MEVPHADVNLLALPDAVGLAEAAVLGCRFGTAYHAPLARGRVAAGEWVAAFGFGGVGLSTVVVAVAAGANVVAVDVSPAALARAEALGAVPVPMDDEAVPAIPMGSVIGDELELLGSHGISVGEYAAMLDDVVAGRLRPAESIGRTIGFDELPEAILAMDRPATSAGMTVAVL